MKIFQIISKFFSKWDRLGAWVLKYRIALLIALIVSTAFMGYIGKDLEIAYEYNSIVPEDDPDMIALKEFRNTFGEEGNIFVIGMQSPKILELPYFKSLEKLSKELTKLEGVNEVIALPNLQQLIKDDSLKKFKTEPIFKYSPQNQAELDSLLKVAFSLKFYEGQLFNQNNHTFLVGISINKEFLNSKKRLQLTPKITRLSEQFMQETGIKVHYSGLPYIRSIMSGKVKNELVLFLVISLIVTALVVVSFFRSWKPLVVSLALILCAVLWSTGVMVLLGYQITAVTGLIPPILVIIAIPNSVYLINEYQLEYKNYQDKRKALQATIARLGLITIVVNLTTAIGFFVFTFSGVSILVEFGYAISVSIVILFVLSILIVPIFYSFLPAPSNKATKHLEFKPIQRLLDFFVRIALHKRKQIYIVAFTLLFIHSIGIFFIKPLAFMVDDLPQTSGVREDLKFFEIHFKGVLPLEIVVDTKVPKGIRKRGVLEKIDSLEKNLYAHPAIAKPISIIGFLKTANQVFYNNDTNFYSLPEQRQWAFFQKYLGSQQNNQNQIYRFFIDSLEQKIRVSFKVAELGTIKMAQLLDETIKPAIEKQFTGQKAQAHVTGVTPLFVKGNSYLVNSLFSSLLLAVVLVALSHSLLFSNLKIILLSLVPTIIPMLITAGLMGFFSIPLKPSTMIIFSIVLGIAVDNTVHFLARYRLQLTNDFNHLHAIEISLRETGISMIYTSFVLFAGFITFTFSEFGGTKALGLLTGITLFVSLITNLFLLPSLLITFDKQLVPEEPVVEGKS